MTITQDRPESWTEEYPEGGGRIRVMHMPSGLPIYGGLTLHVLERFDGLRWHPMAKINAVLTTYRSTPSIAWLITAPGSFHADPSLWLTCRAFTTEGDAIDALWRLHGLWLAGDYPVDIRDAI